MEVVYQGIENEHIPIGEVRMGTFNQSDEDSIVISTSSGGSPDGNSLTALRMKEPATLERVSLNQPQMIRFELATSGIFQGRVREH